ncbi:hypothetical protein QTO34_000031 [Cnephaeus nilssonii]|uniref:Uncharacterized protein n=1 Tax=Cnephaeus nilssonii TaxID=3371016 RepID=A0AA40IAN9_CNENI|nr:hypothetical protein QTO34_000031 [Eptesicus nilssonii]
MPPPGDGGAHSHKMVAPSPLSPPATQGQFKDRQASDGSCPAAQDLLRLSKGSKGEQKMCPSPPPPPPPAKCATLARAIRASSCLSHSLLATALLAPTASDKTAAQTHCRHQPHLHL